MSTDAVLIVARGPREAAEAAATAIDADEALEALTYSILEEDEARGAWRIDAYPTGEAQELELQSRLRLHPALTISVEALADADWLALALSGLPPVRAGRFFVFGAHDRGRVPGGVIALRIEAGAAFGTGHHGTTVGCLHALDALLKRRRFQRVLDIGAGTGILAIAASRTGSRQVVGTDIDRVSVRIARENARSNRARSRFVHAQGLDDPQVAVRAPFDLVMANILALPLVRLAQDIRRVVRRDGVVLLSGLLRTQERLVLAAYRSRGFQLSGRVRRDAWATLILTRR